MKKKSEPFQTDLLCGSVEFDDTNKRFKVTRDISLFKTREDIYSYENIVSFTLMENDNLLYDSTAPDATQKAYQIRQEIGTVQYIQTGIRKVWINCNSLYIHVALQNAAEESVDIPFVTHKVDTGNTIYRQKKENAKKALLKLVYIKNLLDENSAPVSQDSSSDDNGYSAADEIRKFLALKEEGIITEAEYEAKKKQLLGLED